MGSDAQDYVLDFTRYWDLKYVTWDTERDKAILKSINQNRHNIKQYKVLD